METSRDEPGRWKRHLTGRNFGRLVGIVFLAYAVVGYLMDEILIFSGGKARGTGPEYARGHQAFWAALGYVSFAIAAFIFAVVKPKPSARPGQEEFPPLGVVAFALILVGVMLVSCRTPG